MNIAFVANGKKTEFFFHISEEIRKELDNVNIYFICCSKKKYDYYLKQDISSDRLLLINWSIKNLNRSQIGEYKLNELAGYDRKKKFYFNDGIKYLSNLQSVFYDFINNNNIKYVFGEMTWAHEILMAR